MLNLFIARSAILLSIIVAACAPSYDFTNRQVSPSLNPPQKVLVAIVATDTRLDHFPAYYNALEQSLRSDLSACGIQTDSMRISMPALLELSLDNVGKSAQQKIQARIDSYQPDHMLQVNDSTEIGTQITSNAQFIEIPSRRLIEQIGIKKSYWDMPLGSADHGKTMADGIVEQLNDAGVVKNCASKK